MSSCSKNQNISLKNETNSSKSTSELNLSTPINEKIIDYKLNEDSRNSYPVFLNDHIKLPNGIIKKAEILWNEIEGSKLVNKKYYLNDNEINEIIKIIEESSVKKFECTDVILNGVAISLKYEDSKYFNLNMDSSGHYFAIFVPWNELDFSIGNHAGYYCIDSEALVEIMNKITNYSSSEFTDLKNIIKINKISFIDKRGPIDAIGDIKQKITEGLKSAKIANPSACPFNGLIKLNVNDGKNLDIVMAGDDCNMLWFNGSYYQIDMDAAMEIHKLAYDSGTDWWKWEFEKGKND